MNFKLTKVRECRRLTFTGWLILCLLVILLIWIWAISIHGFLAQNKPVDAQILVIEGYVSDSILDSVVLLTKKTSCQLLVCAGLPFAKGDMCSDYHNLADYNSSVLRAKGIDSLLILSAPTVATDKERTYTTALAVKNKLKSMGYDSGSLNVVCGGTHGRRSGLLYRKALNPEWKVGIISFPDNQYNVQAWWHTSEGARAVIYEMFAYLYCFLFFHP